MSLFQFELRKLLLNRKTLIILAALLAIYSAVGFGTSYFLIGSGEAYKTYAGLARPLAGPLNRAKEAEALKTYEAAKERYGDNEEVIYYATSSDPVLKFDVDYAHFSRYVQEYYDGSPTDSLGEPYGVNVLQKKLTDLAAEGRTNTFAYRSVKNQLDTERSLGEPQFANTVEWANLFTNWGDTIMLFILFIPLAFLVSPVFSAEASTGMDNLILSSRNGRRKIVSAKIGAVIVTTLVIFGLYLMATFVFGFLSIGTLEGAAAALRSIPAYVRAPFALLNWQFAVAAALWVLLSGVTYALMVSFISSRLKSQIAVFGISLIVLFFNIAIAALGVSISSALRPVADFGVGRLCAGGRSLHRL